MLRLAPLVRSEVSEEHITSTIILRNVLRLLVIANVFPISQILVTVIMEVVRSARMSLLTSATRHNIPEDYILHSKNLVTNYGRIQDLVNGFPSAPRR
jgi:hypothetical protein